MSTSRSSSRRHSVFEALENYKDIERKSIRKTKIRDLLKNQDYNKMSKTACHRQLPKFSKPNSEKICDCLNEKNGHMTVEELDVATSNREETPGSMCIVLYDELERKSRKSRSKKRKSKTHRKSKKHQHPKSKRNSSSH